MSPHGRGERARARTCVIVLCIKRHIWFCERTQYKCLAHAEREKERDREREK
jgi:hypothetical protein